MWDLQSFRQTTSKVGSRSSAKAGFFCRAAPVSKQGAISSCNAREQHWQSESAKSKIIQSGVFRHGSGPKCIASQLEVLEHGTIC